MSISRILLTGKNGQVGLELQHTLATLGEITALDRQGMNLANPDSIRQVIRDVNPALIVNAAAYTAVDKVESEPDLAIAINGIASGILAEKAKRLGAAITHYSIDYVFDSTKEGPYTATPSMSMAKLNSSASAPSRQSAYHTLILRTSWVYGVRGKNFLLTMLCLAKERDEIRVIDD